MPTATKPKAVRLTERVGDALADSRIDREARLITGVSLCGLESKNGYRYPERVLRDAASKYVKRLVFLDHTDGPNDRRVRDLAAVVENPRYQQGRLRGDLRCLDTEAGRTLLALAEVGSPDLGMSHVIEARRSDDGSEVEEICDVISVDAVFRPATTGGMFESTGDRSMKTREMMELDPAFAPPVDPGKKSALRARLLDILDDPGLNDAQKLSEIRAELETDKGHDDQDAASSDYEEASRDLFGDRQRDRSFVEYLKG